MSNPEAFGIAGKNMETFRGVYVHWGMATETQEEINRFADRFDDIEQVSAHIDSLISEGGCSTFEDFVNGSTVHSDRDVITGNHKSEIYVHGYWVIDKAPEDMDKASLVQAHKDYMEDHPEDEYDLDEFITDSWGEEGVGWVDDKGKFSFTYFDATSELAHRRAKFIKHS